MPRYTLRQLEYFIAVSDTGSIARASERINVSSPSISSAITQLEAEFGLPLFVRQHAQGLSLTQGGRQMLDQARRVLKEANALTDIAADVSGSVRGPLSVGCLMTFAQLVLPGLRRGFEAQYEDVRFQQRELNQAEIYSALRRSDIDVALTYDMDVPADLQFEALVRLRPFALLDADHHLATRDEVTIEDLSAYPMVLLDLPISTDYFLTLFAQQDLTPHISERTRDMAVMRSLVGNGFGYSIVNVQSGSDMSPDGKPMVSVPISGKVKALRMGLAFAHNADRSSVVRAFIDHAKAQVAEGRFDSIGGERLV